LARHVRELLAGALRPWRGDKLLLATHNAGKLEEWRWLLAPSGVVVVSAAELRIAAPEETGGTFVENATLKARAASALALASSCSLILADDAGLSVDDLNGAPGIRTARFATQQGGFLNAALALRRELDSVGAKVPAPCALCCALSLGRLLGRGWRFLTVEAELRGSFSVQPRGHFGFGFDAHVRPEGRSVTLGELSARKRDACNHRAHAIRVLTRQLANDCLSLRQPAKLSRDRRPFQVQ